MLKLQRSQDFGALIRDQRRKLGWSQAELASRIDVRQASVSRLESGKDTVQFYLVLSALRAVGVTLLFDPTAPVKPQRAGARHKVSVNDIVDD